MLVEIVAGALVRGILIEIAKHITGSSFLCINKTINILGVVSFFVAAVIGGQSLGIYLGFFLIDILAVLVIVHDNYQEIDENRENKKKENGGIKYESRT